MANGNGHGSDGTSPQHKTAVVIIQLWQTMHRYFMQQATRTSAVSILIMPSSGTETTSTMQPTPFTTSKRSRTRKFHKKKDSLSRVRKSRVRTGCKPSTTVLVYDGGAGGILYSCKDALNLDADGATIEQ